MGVGMFRSSGNYTAPNPNPKNFTIISILAFDLEYTLLEIKYHGCTTYDGRKLLVYNKPRYIFDEIKELDVDKKEPLKIDSPKKELVETPGKGF